MTRSTTLSGMQKPISKYGDTESRISSWDHFDRWDGSFLWWPTPRVLIAQRGEDGHRIGTPLLQLANIMLVPEDSEFFDGAEGWLHRWQWRDRLFTQPKNRFGPTTTDKFSLSLQDFRLMLIS